MPKCEFIKDDGDRCDAWALTNDVFCLSHTLNEKARRKKLEGSRRGGHSNGDSVSQWEEKELKTTQDVKAALSIAFNAAMLGEISNARATALSSLGSTLIKVIELDDLAEEIKDLQKTIKEMSR